MHIIVCIKQIPDPEIPPVKFQLDADAKRVIPPEGIPPVINPYDEQAVELALRLKEKHEGKITVLSIGDESATGVVRHALAMGADEGMVLHDTAFAGADSFATAYILKQAIKKIGDYDIVFCGRQAADWDEGQVGTILARQLGAPLVTLAERVDFADGHFHVKRVTLDGFQVFEVPAPAVITVSHEVGQPRLPSGWGIISASKKQIPVWSGSDIDADLSKTGENATRRKLVKLFQPDQSRRCEMAEGKTTEEASAALAEKLIRAGAILTKTGD
jgi:electron transfer flavoprotein beta subunit